MRHRIIGAVAVMILFGMAMWYRSHSSLDRLIYDSGNSTSTMYSYKGSFGVLHLANANYCKGFSLEVGRDVAHERISTSMSPIDWWRDDQGAVCWEIRLPYWTIVLGLGFLGAVIFAKLRLCRQSQQSDAERTAHAGFASPSSR